MSTTPVEFGGVCEANIITIRSADFEGNWHYDTVYIA